MGPLTPLASRKATAKLRQNLETTKPMDIFCDFFCPFAPIWAKKRIDLNKTQSPHQIMKNGELCELN
jgi:hypothetical protein